MACLKSSVAARSRFNIPADSDHVSATGVAKNAPPLQRCSIFSSWIALLEDFLLLSPYKDFVFAAPASAHGLSRSHER